MRHIQRRKRHIDPRHKAIHWAAGLRHWGLDKPYRITAGTDLEDIIWNLQPAHPWVIRAWPH